MSDRITKILLGAIALGLWANLFIPLVRPISAIAQYQGDYLLKSIDSHLTSIENDLDRAIATQYRSAYFLESADSRLSSIDSNMGKLQGGSCSNVKLCQ
jgi:hypothetical protein